jgi:hypothetical protein
MPFDSDNNATPIAYSPTDAAEVTGRSRTRIFGAIKMESCPPERMAEEP